MNPEKPKPPKPEPPAQRLVKYRSDNPFLCELWAVYGDLPLPELIRRWKEDHEPEKTETAEP